MGLYVDVHTHLTHSAFEHDCLEVIEKARNAKLGAVVVNGLEPISNRKILNMAQQHDIIQAALGIYPINAVHHLLDNDFPIKVEAFDLREEIDFIREKAKNKEIVAIGECGLDAYWLDESTFSQQEKVFEELLDIAITFDIPAIIHTRKLEKRSIEILEHLGIKKVNFHCYGGRSKWALKAAQKHQWNFSIPANARVNELFTKLLTELPEESILTETDAPYLSPKKGTRNEPANVVATVAYFAELKNMSIDEGKNLIWQNYQKLFQKSSS